MGYFEDELDAAAEAKKRDDIERAQRERAEKAAYENLVAEFIEAARNRQLPTVPVEGFPGHTEAWTIPWYSGDGYADAPRLVFPDGTICAGSQVTIKRRFRGDYKTWKISEHDLKTDYAWDLEKLRAQMREALVRLVR